MCQAREPRFPWRFPCVFSEKNKPAPQAVVCLSPQPTASKCRYKSFGQTLSKKSVQKNEVSAKVQACSCRYRASLARPEAKSPKRLKPEAWPPIRKQSELSPVLCREWKPAAIESQWRAAFIPRHPPSWILVTNPADTPGKLSSRRCPKHRRPHHSGHHAGRSTP